MASQLLSKLPSHVNNYYQSKLLLYLYRIWEIKFLLSLIGSLKLYTLGSRLIYTNGLDDRSCKNLLTDYFHYKAVCLMKSIFQIN